MTLVYNIMFLYRFFFIFNKSLSILQGLVHILQFFYFFLLYRASFLSLFSPPLLLSSYLLSCFMICTFKKHFSMNSTQHHTIYLIIVSGFNQISFEIVIPLPPRKGHSLSSLLFLLLLVAVIYYFTMMPTRC